MEFSTFLFFAALLACPIAMGAMMGKQKNQSMSDPPMTTGSSEERLGALGAQQQALETESAEVTKLAELTTRRQMLRAEQTT